jgi:protein TonB
MTRQPKKYDMLKMPRYPGGSKAFQEFIVKNVRYPKEAEAANIEGSVIVGYDITDNGIVQNAHIIKGLGHGCDEEALRVVSLLQYEKVKNRRVRVKMSTKTTLHFNLNKVSISYSVSGAPNPEKSPPPEAESYSYTITLPE